MQTLAAENQSPRYYHIHLERGLFEGWMVTKEWGAQGSPGRLLKKHFNSIDDAERDVMNSRDNQIKRGYRVVFMEGQNKPQ